MIDWTRLDELRDDLGAETLVDLVDVFLAESDEIAERMDAAEPAGVLADRFHALKGAAANLGLSHVATLCNAAEDAARSSGAAGGDLGRRIADIKDAYGAARIALVEGMQQRYGPGA